MAVRIGAWPRRHDNIAGVRATGVENGSPMCPVWPCAVEFIRSACVPNSASRIQHFSLRMQHSVPVNAKLSIRNVPSLCVLDSALCVSRIQRLPFSVCPGFSATLCVQDSALLCVSRIQRVPDSALPALGSTSAPSRYRGLSGRCGAKRSDVRGVAERARREGRRSAEGTGAPWLRRRGRRRCRDVVRVGRGVGIRRIRSRASTRRGRRRADADDAWCAQ